MLAVLLAGVLGTAALPLAHAAKASGSSKVPGETRWIIFGIPEVPSSWLALEAQTRAVRRLPDLEPFHPTGVAISPGGDLLAFTAAPEGSAVALLHIARSDNLSTPRQIGDRTGFHANPVFHGSGWIYFAHNPFADGEPMKHQSKAYAQIWRIRPDGTGLSQLTTGDGCHFSPSPWLEGLLYIHTDCAGTRWLEGSRDQAGSIHRVGVAAMPAAQSISISPTGDYALFSAPTGSSLRISRVRLLSGETTTVADLSAPLVPDTRPQFGRNSTEVFYQTVHGVWLKRAVEKEPALVTHF
jgi:hypothetical protein